MFPLGDRTLRVAVWGETVREQLAGTAVEQRFDVEAVPADEGVDAWPQDHAADCLVIDGAADEGGVETVAMAREAAPDRSILLLVDDQGVVPAALEAGANETLPRSLSAHEPGLLADRVAAVVEGNLASDALPTIYDGAAGPISLHDAETGAMVHSNAALCDLLGYDRSALRTKTIGDITPDIEGYGHERASRIIQNVAEQGEPLETEWPLERADGTVRWVETSLRPASFGGREFVISAAAEVTERRRREHEYEEIFDGVNDVITVHDPWSEELLAVNETLCDLTGYGEAALLELDVDGFSDTDEGFAAGAPYDLQQRVAATGESETVDWVVETAQGEQRRLEAVLSPATIAGEDRVLVLARDVTERRQLERTYREVFESVSDGLVVHDPETGEILDVNERYCELTGYGREELVGANVRRIVPNGDDDYSFDTALARIEAAREEGSQLFEFKGERKDDGTFTGEIHLSTVEVHGEERVLASVRDVTDRKRRERAIRELQTATERMQDADSAAAVAEIAVETAAEALGLPVTACWFHDADAERLEPVTATDPVYDRNLHSRLASDRYEYDAFQAGAVDTYAPHDENPDNPLETAILLPLGDHGLIAAGRPDETDYDDVILDVARTLAEHTATALDRVERARAVRESERRFRLIADRIDQVIFLSSPDFSEAYYVNEAYEDLWGRPVETLSEDPRSFTAHIDPRDEAALERDFEAMLGDIEAGDPADSYEFEYRIERPDGEVRWVRATGYPVLEDGAEPRFVGIVEDVTDRRELERTYRSVFENVSDGLVVHDPDTGEILDVNERFCAMNGYEREDLVGETIDVVTGPRHAYEEATERIARAREGEPQLFEWRNQRADGETFPVEIHLSVVTVRGAERVLASVRDITERKRREREYEQIFNAVQDGIILMDPETLDILDANDAYLDLVGYDDLETIQELGVDGLSASEEGYSVEASREIHRRVAERGEPEVVEWQARTRDGSRRELEIKVAPAEIGGEAVHVASHRDVTERKRREREFEELFDGVNDSITIHDPETAELVDVNETFCELLGYDRETILEIGIEGYSAAAEGFTKAAARSFVREVVESDEPQQTEWAVETSDGEIHWLDVEGTIVDIGGDPRHVSISRDVTERRRRERMVRSLHESTDELQNAETPREVAAAAIDAATDVLDLWLPTCWLLETDGEAVLRPVAAGEEAQRLSPDQGPRPLEPGDHEYRVFEAGERAVCDPADLDGGTPPGAAVLLPLGEHGLFAAVERDAEGFDDVTLDAAGILARHVRSALDRVEQARELRESERRFRLIAERIDEIVYLATADYSEILYINPAYEEIYGRSIDELAADPTAFVDAAHPADREAYQADVDRLVADIDAGDPDDAYDGQYRIHRNGETRWVTATRFPVENEDGTIDRIVGRVQDVTERKRREREYEQIFDNVTDAIAVHDPETGALIDVNDTYVDQFGYDVETIRELGVEGLSLTEEEFSAGQAEGIIQRVAETGEAETVEWQVETAEGEERVYEVNATAASIGGEERVLAINRDVTEERRTERRLRAILDRIDEAIYLAPAHEITQASQNPDYVSSGYAAIWGQSLDGIRDRYEEGFFGTLHPDEEADYRAFVEGIVDDIDAGDAQDRYSKEYRIRTPADEVRWVQSDYYPVEWTSGPPRIVIVSREITARKERERRLVSFEDATEDLATADTRQEAASTAVDAATEALQLSAVGVFLYDESEGVLRPEVRAPALPDAIGARPVGPEDGPLWRAFATGTVVTAEQTGRTSDQSGAATRMDGATGLTDWHGIPLGNHGVLFVGTREGTLGPDTLQSAHILGATLEAALNHLHGRREVADREAELRTETERAERLDRIARLTQQVEAAITEASDPAEVERAVCDRLVEADPYAVAWIGGVEVGTDRLTPRTVVGESRRYVEGMDLVTTADAADQHPAVVAWQTDSVAVAESIVGEGAAGAWRQHVLSKGYQSVCAVPLTYDGITHGVLTVAADAPNAFGDRARRVLDQLGTSIGHALAGIERRRALESDETVELVFEGAGTGLEFARLAAEVGATVRHERTVRRADGDVSVYFAIEGALPGDAVETAQRLLSGTVDVVRDEADSLLIEVVADSWFGSPLAEYGAVLRAAEAAPDGTTISVELPARSDVRSFTDRLQELTPSLALEAKRQHQRSGRTTEELRNRIEERLTDRQHEALRTAYGAGYFEWPRESDGGEVAERLDITQPTFNKHLRLAERKTFGALFESEA